MFKGLFTTISGRLYSSIAAMLLAILALEVLEKLIETHPGASLCMVGPDKDGSLEKCKRFAEEKQLPVTFTGKLSKEEWNNFSTG